MNPEYDFDEFVVACETTKNVLVTQGAEQDARDDFNIKTKRDLISYIGDGLLENREFINSKPWENHPEGMNCDAYEFRTIERLGYISIAYSEKMGKWFIKSFHLSKNSGGIMAAALLKSGIMIEGR